MKKYRIKEKNGRFYPQYKKIIGWRYYKGQPYWDYGVMSFITGEKDCVYFKNLYFESFKDANDFLIIEKESDSITYHKIKE